MSFNEMLKVGDSLTYLLSQKREIASGGFEYVYDEHGSIVSVRGEATITDIVARPDADSEVIDLIDRLMKQSNSKKTGVIDGKHLLDDENLRGRVDPNSIYVVER